MTGQPTALPPFSGDDPTCPKCGNVGADTRFLAYGSCSHEAGLILGNESNERLHRECRRCEYAWDEATVKQAPVEAK
jgi:predicted nucleic-acid-binding Zn-ribbon protein